MPRPVTLPPPTTRLTFRAFTAADGGNVHRVVGDAEVLRFLEGDALPRECDADEVLAPLLATAAGLPGYGRLCVETRDDQAFVGWVSLMPRVPDPGPMYGGARGEAGAPVVELGYRIVRTSWGHGLATEAARAAVEHATTTLGANAVVATTMAVNTGSRRVLERLGFVLTAVRVLQWEQPNPGWEEGEAEYVLAAPPDPCP